MKKRYWLRGGLIFSGVVLLSIIMLLLGEKMDSKIVNILSLIIVPALFIEIIALIPLGLILGGLLGLREEIFVTSTGEFSSMPTLLGLSLLIVIWFIIGAGIGWLYGKIKNRNKVI